jgi:tetratricopeptide (TPR) repeat protein
MASVACNSEWLESVRIRTAQAERYFREARHEACREVILQLQAEGVDTPLARAGLAMIDYIEGRSEAAVAHLARAEELGRAPARVWELIGRLYLRLRRITDASRALDRAIATEPASASARHARGLAHLLAGDPATAEREFRKALNLGARSFEAHYHLAVALERQQRIDDAIQSLKTAINVAPPAAGPAHRRLADLLQRRGEIALALHHRALAQRREFSGRPREFDVEWLRQGLAT